MITETCKRCGRAMMRGMMICACIAGLHTAAGNDEHIHRDVYLFRPTTEIVALATSTSTGTPPLRVNGQSFYVR